MTPSRPRPETERWIAEAKAAGLRVIADQVGMNHIVNEVDGWSQCGKSLRVGREGGDPAFVVCLHCRELPGRRRHEDAVLEAMRMGRWTS